MEVIVININIGMPEFLLIFSLGMYQNSQTIAITAFCLAVFASVCKFAMTQKDSIDEQ